jgi:F420-non-reducing hydrogenase iron-sulfur subunit
MTFEPKIVGFLCNWCSYTGADLAGTARIKYAPNIRSIRVMCSGRIEPTFIIKALFEGADGVLIAGCHPGDCHYQEGNYKALRRHLLLQRILPEYGVEPERVRLEWVAASEGERFATIVDEFTEQIRELGPLGVKESLAEAMKSDIDPHEKHIEESGAANEA